MHDLLSTRARSGHSSAIRDLLRLTEQPGILSLAGGLPTAESFPTDELRGAAARILDASGPYGPQALQYGRTEGVTELRELVAAQSGVPAETVVVTTGSQQALDLIARCTIDPGDVVVVESPTYVGALQAIRAFQPAFEPVPGDLAGLDTIELERRLVAGLRPTLCYVVSNFANPTGATMSLERREHLLRLAQRYGFLVLEDDPYGDLRFRGRPVPSIRSLPGAAEHVASLRTVSKTLAPGLRLGWAALPTWLTDAVVVAKQGVDLHTSTLSQLLALDLLSDVEAHASAGAHVGRALRPPGRGAAGRARAPPRRPDRGGADRRRHVPVGTDGRRRSSTPRSCSARRSSRASRSCPASPSTSTGPAATRRPRTRTCGCRSPRCRPGSSTRRPAGSPPQWTRWRSRRPDAGRVPATPAEAGVAEDRRREGRRERDAGDAGGIVLVRRYVAAPRTVPQRALARSLIRRPVLAAGLPVERPRRTDPRPGHPPTASS